MRVAAIDQPGDSEGASGARHEGRQPRSRAPHRSWSGPVACRRVDPTISALAVGRTRTVAEPRWSPDGARLGWIESFAGPGRSRGRCRPTAAGPPPVVTPDIAVTGVGAYGGGAWCWGSDDEVVYAAADGRLVAVAGRTAAPPGSSSARGPGARRPAARGRDRRVRPRPRVTHATSRRVPLDGSGLAGAVSTGGDFAWDPTLGVGGVRVGRVGPPVDAVRRVADPALGRRAGAPRVVAGGGPVSVGQPRFSPDGVAPRVRLRRDRLVERLGRRRRRLGRAPGARGGRTTTRRRRGDRGSARSRGRPTASAIAISRNEDGFGRLIVVDARSKARRRTRASSRRAGTTRSTGVRTGSSRCAPARARRRPSRSIDPDTADRAASSRAARRPGIERDAGRARGGHVAQRQRDRARAALPAGASRRSGRGRAPPLLVLVHGGPDRPGDRRAGSRASAYFVDRGLGRPAPGPPRLDRLRPRVRAGAARAVGRARRRRHRGRHPRRGRSAGGATPTGSRSWVGARAGSPRCSCARSTARSCAPGVSLFGVTNLFDLAETTHRFESRYLDWLVGELPATRPTATVEHSPVTHAAAIRVPLLVLQGDADNVVPPAQAQEVVDTVRGAGGTVEHHVYEGEGHGWAQAGDDDRRARAGRGVPHPMGASRPMTSASTSTRDRSAARTGRCCSRTAPARTCTPRR